MFAQLGSLEADFLSFKLTLLPKPMFQLYEESESRNLVPSDPVSLERERASAGRISKAPELVCPY